MVLDELKDTDDIFKVNGFTVLVDKQLLEQVKNVTVDYVNHGVSSGFQLTSEIPVGGGGAGGCSPSCSC